MPKQAPDFSDEQFTAVTGEGTPTETKPGVITWNPIYVLNKKPVLRFYLTTIRSTRTAFLQFVTVTLTRAKTITVTVYTTRDTTGTPVYSKTVPTADSGTTTVYTSPEDSPLPIEASVVDVTLGEPKKPEETTYDTTVELVGCFEPLVGK
jgi:hypothetical protein